MINDKQLSACKITKGWQIMLGQFSFKMGFMWDSCNMVQHKFGAPHDPRRLKHDWDPLGCEDKLLLTAGGAWPPGN